MPQSIYRYRGYLVGWERRNGLLLVSVSPATPDLPILPRYFFQPPRNLKPKRWQKLRAAWIECLPTNIGRLSAVLSEPTQRYARVSLRSPN